MLGWHISVYRVADTSAFDSLANIATAPLDQDASTALWSVAPGTRVGVWQTGLEGLDWIRVLVDGGKAAALPSNGYPNRFFARARDLLPVILNGPPAAHERWVCGPNDIISPAWAGKTVIDQQAAVACTEHEWLLIEAWDES